MTTVQYETGKYSKVVTIQSVTITTQLSQLGLGQFWIILVHCIGRNYFGWLVGWSVGWLICQFVNFTTVVS